MSDLDPFALGGQQGTEALQKRWDALVRELVQVGRLLPPPAQEPPPAPPATRPEPTPAENEALRIECEAIAAAYRAPLPDGDAGLIAAVQRWHDMRARMRLTARGFNLTIDREAEIVEPTAYAAEEELDDFIEHTPAEGLPGVLAKLQWIIVFNPYATMRDYAEMLEQIAGVVAAACHQRGWLTGE
ncbi:MAG: hypothetical protein JO001_12210 [Alphaproteobacteria bacterium]|nr:hypothetical protein [Alphaproteobacteria bacterium]